MEDRTNDNNNEPRKDPAHSIVAEYIIEETDTLPEIARKYDVSIEDIIAANPDINDTSGLIEPGKKIMIPNKKSL